MIKNILAISTLAMGGFVNAEQRFVIPVNIEGQLTGYSVDTQRGLLNITALSGGCLSKENFQVRIQEIYPPVVSIVQTSLDPCEALVGPKTLVYSFEELQVGDNAIQVQTKSTVGLSKR